VVKRAGDGALVDFRSVVAAVRCAIEVQNAIIERNAGVNPGAPNRVPDRHTSWRCRGGERGDLMGDAVNIASRLQSVATPGAICLSEDAYRQLRQDSILQPVILR
jgi:adenylate cyclase